MPQTNVFFYRGDDGSVPVLDWLDELHRTDLRAYNKCLVVIDRLAQTGHELRRPTSDFVSGGVYELRARVGHVNFRILYFFHGRNVAILAHGLTKEREIPKSDLAIALARKKRFEADSKRHTYVEQ